MSGYNWGSLIAIRSIAKLSLDDQIEPLIIEAHVSKMLRNSNFFHSPSFKIYIFFKISDNLNYIERVSETHN